MVHLIALAGMCSIFQVPALPLARTVHRTVILADGQGVLTRPSILPIDSQVPLPCTEKLLAHVHVRKGGLALPRR